MRWERVAQSTSVGSGNTTLIPSHILLQPAIVAITSKSTPLLTISQGMGMVHVLLSLQLPVHCEQYTLGRWSMMPRRQQDRHRHRHHNNKQAHCIFLIHRRLPSLLSQRTARDRTARKVSRHIGAVHRCLLTPPSQCLATRRFGGSPQLQSRPSRPMRSAACRYEPPIARHASTIGESPSDRM
jgi:hypothetical protein